MRIKTTINTKNSFLNWDEVLSPARSVVYEMIQNKNENLSNELHDNGWKGHRIKPVSVSSPLFKSRVPQKYSCKGEGTLFFSSPAPQIIGAIYGGLLEVDELKWGSATFNILDCELLASEASSSIFKVCTPLVITDENKKFLLPQDESYIDNLKKNCVHKADIFGTDNNIEIEIISNGTQRKFGSGKHQRIGATVNLDIHAAAETLAVLRDTGLGLSNISGFGWVK